MPNITIDEFAEKHGFKGTGALSVAVLITEYAITLRERELLDNQKYFPINPEDLLAESGSQVKGLNANSIQVILKKHNITKILSAEAGRTNRGVPKQMKVYVEYLNGLNALGELDLQVVEKYWISRVLAHFDGKPLELKLDPSWSLRESVRNLISQAAERQKKSGGNMYVGTFMQHMVGAKLQVLLGENVIHHHSANQSDVRLDRHGDFDIEDVAIHVTSSPSAALIRKCGQNLGKGKRPIIVTSQKGLVNAEVFLEEAGISNRVDTIEFEQFIATNIFEMGKFKNSGRVETFHEIVIAYNAIIEQFENPSLRIAMTAGK